MNGYLVACDYTSKDTGFGLAVNIPKPGGITIAPGATTTITISTNGVSPTEGLKYPANPGYYEAKIDLNKNVQVPVANSNPVQYN
jgi:hypothetical protein